jgi:hypothetical protein
MRKKAVLLFAVALSSSSAIRAEETRPDASAPAASTTGTASASAVRMRPDLEAQHARLVGKLRPEVRTKLKGAVRRTMDTAWRKTVTSNDLLAAAREGIKSSLGALASRDLEAMAYVVLIEATKEARDEASIAAARVDAVRRARECRRDLKCLEALASKGEISKQAAERAIEDVKDNRDSLSELNEALSERMKAYMERLAKMEAIASELMKKMSETSSDIVENIK